MLALLGCVQVVGAITGAAEQLSKSRRYSDRDACGLLLRSASTARHWLRRRWGWWCAHCSLQTPQTHPAARGRETSKSTPRQSRPGRMYTTVSKYTCTYIGLDARHHRRRRRRHGGGGVGNGPISRTAVLLCSIQGSIFGPLRGAWSNSAHSVLCFLISGCRAVCCPSIRRPCTHLHPLRPLHPPHPPVADSQPMTQPRLDPWCLSGSLHVIPICHRRQAFALTMASVCLLPTWSALPRAFAFA